MTRSHLVGHVVLAVVVAISAAGCLSDGKFYTFSSPPTNMTYPDSGASPIGLTDGVKLTDAKLAQKDPGKPDNTFNFWNLTERGRFVGWQDNVPINVTVDLGRVYRISTFGIDAASYPPYGIYFPSNVQILTSETNPNPSAGSPDVNFTGNLPAFPADCTLNVNCPSADSIPRTNSILQLPQGQVLNARYIKFRIHHATGTNFVFLDEVAVDGIYDNPQRFVPAANSVYHGAFAIQEGCNPARYQTDTASFEALVGKQLATYLDYQNWVDQSFTYTSWPNPQQLVATHAAKGLILGVQPNFNKRCTNDVSQACSQDSECGSGNRCRAHMPLDEINQGKYDQAIANWFASAAQQLGSGPGKINKPLFFRFGAEMNGDWADYGGSWNNDPGQTNGPDKFIAAWRRVYNIAQAEGAGHPNNVLFTWSPAAAPYPSPTTPGYEWNAVQRYFPGAQYVEWVGVNLYWSYQVGARFVDQVGNNSPAPVYNLYSGSKPMMLGENGAAPTINAPVGDSVVQYNPVTGKPILDQNDKLRGINELFNSLPQFPRIQGITWFNASICDPTNDYSLNSVYDVIPALPGYQAAIANSRYITTIQGN